MSFTPISTYYNYQSLAEKYERKVIQESLPEEIEEQPPSGAEDIPAQGKNTEGF